MRKLLPPNVLAAAVLRHSLPAGCMRQYKLRCHNQLEIKNKQTMVGCVINVAAAGGSRKVQSEGGEICKAYFASFCVFKNQYILSH